MANLAERTKITLMSAAHNKGMAVFKKDPKITFEADGHGR